jgi:hypothetical protein
MSKMRATTDRGLSLSLFQRKVTPLFEDGKIGTGIVDGNLENEKQNV